MSFGLTRCALLLVALGALAAGARAEPEDAASLLRSAEALQQRGFRTRALEQLERARAQLEAAPRAELAPAVEGALGKAYLLTGRREEAKSHLERALAEARRTGKAAITAAVLNDLGNLAAIERRSSDATGFYNESIAGARAAGLPGGALQAATNLARLGLADGNPQAALAAANASEKDLAALSDPRQQAAALLGRGDLFERLYAALADRRLLERSYRSYARASALGEGNNDLRLLAFARGGLARLYEADKRYAEALELNRLAIGAALAVEAEDSLYRWHWQSGRVLAALGRGDEAIAAYRRAELAFQGVRRDLIQELRALNASYREAAGPLYLEYADLLLERARRLPEGAEREKVLLGARDLVEQIKSVELEDYFQDECVARLQAKQKAIDRVAAATAVLYPVFLKNRVEVLMSLPSGMRQIVLAASPRELEEESRALRRLLEKRTTREYLPHARRLYEGLFQPLEQALSSEQVRTVVLVPDGPLRGVPLAALHDGKDFLVQRYAFATAPGLSLVEPKPINAQAPAMLLSGLSKGVQSFPPLPFVNEEIDALHKLTGGRVLRDAEFRQRDLERELARQPYSVVHIASHGQFDADPKKSFLLTFDGKLDMDALERDMKLTRFREDPVELLTLSACRTAAGDDRAALGLAGVAVKAGARSALATLWFVNDQASSALVVDFYHRIAAGESKVSALQAAQQRLLADPRFRHPSYWAPFLLIGNWL
ncbi:MAG TPA: CHAT domain-containing protein [Burkholderiales bacterium]|nr:CHAT domain-containing protein [Burkholderiales bacterium]